jgi:hypothetical protein
MLLVCRSVPVVADHADGPCFFAFVYNGPTGETAVIEIFGK